jgi:hypothetical protein
MKVSRGLGAPRRAVKYRVYAPSRGESVNCTSRSWLVLKKPVLQCISGPSLGHLCLGVGLRGMKSKASNLEGS